MQLISGCGYFIYRIFTIYTRVIPLDLACRVWDIFCRDGDIFLYKTALGNDIRALAIIVVVVYLLLILLLFIRNIKNVPHPLVVVNEY